jgi:serine phosphatase RsbU (regulator of sigma subunit)
VLAAGRTRKGEPITDDKTISHSILQEALKANSEFLVTDTSASEDLSLRQSIVAFDLRTVICIPLRRPQVQTIKQATAPADEVMGALYVDSRLISRELSSVSHDILRAIATEAASLIENANLVQAEEANRRYEQEIAIAATIQQRLMAVTLPDVSFALVDGKNLACKEVGGDFYDWVNTPDGLALVICDVSGKGIAAAILASTLQGMVYSHLISGMGLQDIVTAVNRFFHDKNIGEKYATMILLRIKPNGDLEYANCGHIQPLVISHGAAIRLTHGNVPVGLIPGAPFSSAHHQLNRGDRLILVSDGVTEAENTRGDFFDNEGLDAAALRGPGINVIFHAIDSFCGSMPLNDDCTVVELTYLG